MNPVKIYKNALLSKSDMIKDFKNKTIIYLWFNKVTGKVYVVVAEMEPIAFIAIFLHLF